MEDGSLVNNTKNDKTVKKKKVATRPKDINDFFNYDFFFVIKRRVNFEKTNFRQK